MAGIGPIDVISSASDVSRASSVQVIHHVVSYVLGVVRDRGSIRRSLDPVYPHLRTYV